MYINKFTHSTFSSSFTIYHSDINLQATIIINFTNTLDYAPFRTRGIQVINQHIICILYINLDFINPINPEPSNFPLRDSQIDSFPCPNIKLNKKWTCILLLLYLGP